MYLVPGAMWGALGHKNGIYAMTICFAIGVNEKREAGLRDMF